LESRLTDALGRPTTVETVAFDPFRLRLTLGRLSIARLDGPEPLFAVDQLVADLSAASLWHRAPVLDSLRILRPRLSLTRDAQGQYNIDDLIEAIFSKRIVLPLVSLNNIEIDDGNVVLVDEVTGAIVETGLEVDESTSHGEIIVSFRHDPALGLWVPGEMTEIYRTLPRLQPLSEGKATYSKYRRFQVKTEEKIIIPR
jgi:hypothetical protein